MAERDKEDAGGRRLPARLGRRPWTVVTVAYFVAVIVFDLVVGRDESVLGLLVITPVLLAFEWGPAVTAATTLPMALTVSTGLFGLNDTSAAENTTRGAAALALGVLSTVASADRRRRERVAVATQTQAAEERRARELAETNERRHAAASALAGALELPDVLNAIFEHALPPLGPDVVSVWLLDDKRDVILFRAGLGHDPRVPERFGRIPLDSDLPAARVVRSGDPLVYRSRAERNERWPLLKEVPGTTEATAIMPLTARGKTFGVISFGYTAPRTFSADELALLGAATEECALALDRAFLYEDERQARDTLELLADGTQLLLSALEPDEVVRRLVHLAVPRLSDWCAFYTAQHGLLYLRQLATVAGDAAGRLAGHVGVRIDAEQAPAAVAYRTGEIQYIEYDDPEQVFTHYPEELRSVARTLRLRHVVALPIHASGKIIGAMSVGYTAGRRHDSPHEQFALLGLAGRAGIALDNARRFREQVDTVQTLTSALLPARLPQLPGLDVAARYVPAAGRVCGDWYEADVLPEGGVLFGVGDAAGHGIEASAVMAQVRNAARGLAVVGTRPGPLLSALSKVTEAAADDIFATAAYGELDPVSGLVTIASAGHPPPLVLTRGSAPAYLPVPRGLPLGVSPRTSYGELECELHPGDLLLLVTDGVIERRGESLDVGLGRLASLVDAHRDDTPDQIADAVVTELCADREDDCCVLVVRRDG